MNAKEINEVEYLLKTLIHNAIIKSMHDMVERCKNINTKPEEPDFIAALTLQFTSEFFEILRSTFPKKKFSVTGVFCHQKPIVDIGLVKDTELGDILFVYVHKDSQGTKKYNSLLFQAKRSKHPSIKVSSTDMHQLELYTNWPKFTYKKSGILNGESRDILPKATNDGAQYLLIDDDPILGLLGFPGTFPMGCATPAKILSINNDLACELIDFLKFKSGRTFEADPIITKDEWTKMIWEILEATKDKASKRKNAGIANLPRQNINDLDGYCFYLAEVKSLFSELHNTLEENDSPFNTDNFFDGNNFSDEDNISPSVILIECNEQNEG
jgi:hypothetical protein